MLNLTRPKYVMPMHGDFKRIRLHVDARRVRRRRPGAHLPQLATASRSRSTAREPGSATTSAPGMIFVDGLELGEPDDAALRDRRTLSADGLVIVVATVSIEDSEVAADPEITFRGVPMQSRATTANASSTSWLDVVEDKLEDALRGHVREPAMIREDVHDAVATFVYKRLKRRPMVLPVVDRGLGNPGQMLRLRVRSGRSAR